MDIADGPVRDAPALYPPTVAPPPHPLGLTRFLIQFVRNPLLALPQAVYEEPLLLAPTRRRIAWVTDPALVERILLHEHESFPKTPLEKRVFEQTLGDGILTSQGQSWRWQRRTAAPLFRHQDLLAHIPAMTSAAQEQVERWRRFAPGDVQPIERGMTDLTFDVFTSTLLAGADRADGEIIKRSGTQFLSRISWEIAWAMVGLPPWAWHPAKGTMRRSAVAMRGAVERIVAQRRAGALQPGQEPARDILGRLLAARDPESGEPMSDKQIADNLLTFIAAGHETTAKALTWTLYLLARAPEWQDALRTEIAGVCGASPVAARHLEGLRLTQMVLKESMRLYPPAPVLSREVGRDLELGGIPMAAGTLIVIPIFAIHRHRRLWVDPDRFDPQRFAPGNEANQLRTQFMPFGFGPRTCIGMAFAMIEATVVLATLVRAVRFDWDGRHLPEPVSRVTLRPKGGMPLAVTVL